MTPDAGGGRTMLAEFACLFESIVVAGAGALCGMETQWPNRA